MAPPHGAEYRHGHPVQQDLAVPTPETDQQTEVLTWAEFGVASRSVVHPDYHWGHTDRWISSPWSADPPVTAG